MDESEVNQTVSLQLFLLPPPTAAFYCLVSENYRFCFLSKGLMMNGECLFLCLFMIDFSFCGFGFLFGFWLCVCLFDQKLTALKKAYADIILNTAKEAAARIMVSERKATRFQQELASTKEESLRMLLRLKQMLDSKV